MPADTGVARNRRASQNTPALPHTRCAKSCQVNIAPTQSRPTNRNSQLGG